MLRRRSFQVLVILAVLASVTGGGAMPKTGDLVLANWEKGAFAYPAKVTGIKGKMVSLKYEDGATETLPADFVKMFDWKIGTAVQCNWQGKGTYYSGKITKIALPKVSIAYDDGDKEETTIVKCREKTGEEEESTASSSGLNKSSCTFNGKKLYGKIQFVTSFPDIKAQIVTSFPDLKVQMVSSFPDSCGKWEEVTSFPDLKVQIVDSFPDVKIEYVTSFPGMN